MENKEFKYNYVAPTGEERKEIDRIRKQYLPQEKVESKLERLRRLDHFVHNSAMIVSLVLGVVGCLCFGLGLTLVLEWKQMLLGVLLAAVGCVPMGVAYPAYAFVLKKNKQKYGAEILRLSEEILKEE